MHLLLGCATSHVQVLQLPLVPCGVLLEPCVVSLVHCVGPPVRRVVPPLPCVVPQGPASWHLGRARVYLAEHHVSLTTPQARANHRRACGQPTSSSAGQRAIPLKHPGARRLSVRTILLHTPSYTSPRHLRTNSNAVLLYAALTALTCQTNQEPCSFPASSWQMPRCAPRGSAG